MGKEKSKTGLRPAITLTQSETDNRAHKLKLDNAHALGWNAFRSRESKSTNPFEDGTEEFEQFLIGYASHENLYGPMRKVMDNYREIVLQNASRGVPKGSFNDDEGIGFLDEGSDDILEVSGQKSRGRPKGVKNGYTTKPQKLHTGRGRPKGSKNKPK